MANREAEIERSAQQMSSEARHRRSRSFGTPAKINHGTLAVNAAAQTLVNSSP
jgi:hypothetical protein